ncbi:hypothetical protein [Rhizobium leguminosarum]
MALRIDRNPIRQCCSSDRVCDDVILARVPCDQFFKGKAERGTKHASIARNLSVHPIRSYVIGLRQNEACNREPFSIEEIDNLLIFRCGIINLCQRGEKGVQRGGQRETQIWYLIEYHGLIAAQRTDETGETPA